MTLGTAVLLLVLSITGIVIASRRLRKRKTLRLVCIVLCAALALLLAGYIGLTALFLDAARNAPPA